MGRISVEGASNMYTCVALHRFIIHQKVLARLCLVACVETADGDCATQTWEEDKREHNGAGKQAVVLPRDCPTELVEQNDKADTKERERLELATFFTHVNAKDSSLETARTADTASLVPVGLGKGACGHSGKVRNGDVVGKETNQREKVEEKYEPDTDMDNGDESENGDKDDSDDDCDNEEDSANKDYYWDDERDAWAYKPRKRKRRKDLTNNKGKKWTVGMGRNWDTKKYEKMMASITIKRDNLDMVTLAH
jgi:hypothetical protein